MHTGWLTGSVAALALSAVSAQGTSSPELIAARKAELRSLLDRYASGDHDVVASTPQNLFADRFAAWALRGLFADPVRSMVPDPDAPWSRARAAFLLEAVVAASRSPSPSFTQSVLPLGRMMVTGRPATVGANAEEDRFEILWHQIALALMQQAGAWDAHNHYLESLGLRMVQFARLSPPPRSRFAMARAMNAAEACCPTAPRLVTTIDARSRGAVTVNGRRLGGPSTSRLDADHALAIFDSMRDDAEQGPEASVRAAYLAQRTGRAPMALTLADRALPSLTLERDKNLMYVASLVRAVALDRLGQLEAAADAYQSAGRVYLDAQTPAIGLAAALHRLGRSDDAMRAAAAARRLPPNAVDPFHEFMRADARFVDQWLRELRTLIR